MPDAQIQIRPLSEAEVGQAIDWAAREGWNPGLDDTVPFRAADPDGFIGLFEDGRLAATISVVTYGPRFAFLGFYIVRPDRRGRGLGLRLWQAGLDHGGTRTIGLDGVVAQQDNYRRSGFELAHRNIRYGGQIAGPFSDLDPRIHIIAPELMSRISLYDRGLFPADRAVFLTDWLAPRHGRALAFIEMGRVLGYGVIRACRQGYKIGPLFADRPGVAEALYGQLVRGLTGRTVYLDVPEPNAEAVALAERHGLTPAFETARMYRGPAPHLPLERIFGITSFELG